MKLILAGITIGFIGHLLCDVLAVIGIIKIKDHYIKEKTTSKYPSNSYLSMLKGCKI